MSPTRSTPRPRGLPSGGRVGKIGNPMKWYLSVLKQYATFSGRARRSEYWFFVLFNLIAFAVLFGIDMMLGMASEKAGMGILSGLYSLGVIVPSIAVAVRRMHDQGRSGWFVLTGLIPCVGGLVLLYFLVQPGTVGANEYGVDPQSMAG
jgi:uncharacterized membrane protein YhaH (DUF805 family)